MQRINVVSSSIESVGFDGGRAGTLEVEFHNGAIWRYYDVPGMVYSALVNAYSIGSYFNEHIKGTYASENVTDKLHTEQSLTDKYPEHAKLKKLQGNPELMAL